MFYEILTLYYNFSLMDLEQVKGFINTPTLWEGKLLEVEQFNFPLLELENFTIRDIPKNIRLGHQVEHIFNQLVNYHKGYEILLVNQPIKNEIRTIGEIDFIIQNTETKEITHIELTYKFYIIDITISDKVHQLIGPNKRDSFYDKIEKIKNKQFKLLHTKEAANLLHNNKIAIKKNSSKTVFKAQLFKPYKANNLNIAPFNNDCICGYWLRMRDFDTLEFNSQYFYLPSKKEWIIATHENVVWSSFKNIKTEIEESHKRNHSPMVWMKKSQQEFEKFFIIFW